jgi:signal transduction histidine kinase
MFLLWYSIRRGLKPLVRVASEIATRKVDCLESVDADSSPREVRPMVLAVNDLLSRVGRALENERSFTANAAHELRTPLAATRAHLAAAQGASNAEERERSLGQLQRGLERGARLVDQLLTLSRLDPEQTLTDVESVAIAPMLESLCAELAPLALRRAQCLELSVAPGLPALRGEPGLLAMLLTNLVDNAIRYTPENGRILVNARLVEQQPCIEVLDDGPGVAPEFRQRVFERFFRLADQSNPGSGLGLAICQRIVALHRARIELSEGLDGKGLAVRVWIPVESTPGESPHPEEQGRAV